MEGELKYSVPGELAVSDRVRLLDDLMSEGPTTLTEIADESEVMRLLVSRSEKGARHLRYVWSDFSYVAEGEGSLIFTASLLDDPKRYIVKVQTGTEEKDYEQSIHELFINLLVTNRLRSTVPNFALTLGQFVTSPPFIRRPPIALTRDEIQIETWGQTRKGATLWIVQEYIEDAVTLGEFIESGCSLEQYLSLLVQLLFALQVAYERFAYTHFDLHPSNVLVKRLPEERQIAYPFGTITTNYLAVIIDQEMAYVEVDGRPFPSSYFERVTPSEDVAGRSFPMYDVYRLLVGSAIHSLGRESLSKRTKAPPVNEEVYLGVKRLTEGLIEGEDTFRISVLYGDVYDYTEERDISPFEFYERVVYPAFPELIDGFLSPGSFTERVELSPRLLSDVEKNPFAAHALETETRNVEEWERRLEKLLDETEKRLEGIIDSVPSEERYASAHIVSIFDAAATLEDIEELLYDLELSDDLQRRVASAIGNVGSYIRMYQKMFDLVRRM